jgi:hypothetical protein
MGPVEPPVPRESQNKIIINHKYFINGNIVIGELSG